MNSVIHVAAGVIYDRDGNILIAQRPAHLHQGGLWEFPGGKVQEGESVIAALTRELQEEIGIHVTQTRPLIQIHHDYGDKQVWLDVYEVLGFTGKEHGREGQPLQWVTPAAIAQFQFPAANVPIVHAVQLPMSYMITGAFTHAQECMTRTHAALQKGIKLVQLRAKHLDVQEYGELARQMLALCHQYSAQLLLNAEPSILTDVAADGVHLTSSRLMLQSRRPVADDKWLFASVHNTDELMQAQRIGVDAIVIAPVHETTTHPGQAALGWQQFTRMAKHANCPAYALGGVSVQDFMRVREAGGHGVAGIRAFW